MIADSTMRRMLREAHPDLVMLPMFPWMRQENIRAGRNNCTVSDWSGTHIRDCAPLMAYLHMVLNAIENVDRLREQQRQYAAEWGVDSTASK